MGQHRAPLSHRVLIFLDTQSFTQVIVVITFLCIIAFPALGIVLCTLYMRRLSPSVCDIAGLARRCIFAVRCSIVVLSHTNHYILHERSEGQLLCRVPAGCPATPRLKTLYDVNGAPSPELPRRYKRRLDFAGPPGAGRLSLWVQSSWLVVILRRAPASAIPPRPTQNHFET